MGEEVGQGDGPVLRGEGGAAVFGGGEDLFRREGGDQVGWEGGGERNKTGVDALQGGDGGDEFGGRGEEEYVGRGLGDFDAGEEGALAEGEGEGGAYVGGGVLVVG